AGDAPAGLALAKEIRTPLWATNAFQEVALALQAAGDLPAAVDTAGQVPSERGRVQVLAALGRAWLEAGAPPVPGLIEALARLLDAAR
ncbi:MAG: hypothetical protein FJ098_12295, partial [Deltaproteobacteria bacterium]|nr:hypothetical protein [Deltaproteobacteria bacterium]